MGLNDWLAEHMLLTYVIIFVMIAYVYNKVFRVRRLPILKNIVVYILIAVGTLMLWIFQIDASLPIVQSLGVAIIMMIIYRLRVLYLSRGKKSDKKAGSVTLAAADDALVARHAQFLGRKVGQR